ncbi:hypothetical protein [Anaerosalibacter massiliensis]|uniref:Uncharacterized protein n=1 Tax=Anaerosalibacter massiliensis TaxID=1347392 RepID=A0A9X2MG89_9FIRM|nr:hypothetical protein [Anaerosalibacter massiliensis]MCR2043443.1 hypothetical protein [Anaerosalibacter massiliensis]
MKQNKYDDEIFFEKYSKMDRSIKGLDDDGILKIYILHNINNL